MPDPAATIRPFYERWERYSRQFVDGIRDLTDEQLAIRPSPDGWPIWATVAHTAGARTYWLCGVFGEPGAALTPFPDALSGEGWEDDLDHPRSAEELVLAFETTWNVVAGVLDRWTPAMLGERVERKVASGVQHHSRESVLMRLISHEAYHAGELSQTLGIHGLPQIDLWPPELLG